MFPVIPTTTINIRKGETFTHCGETFEIFDVATQYHAGLGSDVVMVHLRGDDGQPFAMVLDDMIHALQCEDPL